MQNYTDELDHIRAAGFTTDSFTDEFYQDLAEQGVQAKTFRLAVIASLILQEGQPMSLRGLFYRVVSAGYLPSTEQRYYHRLMRILTLLREREFIPFAWIVDGIRQTMKPSSWSGLADFADTVRDAYRLDFWERLPRYVHILCEKDAIAGALYPVTHQYDVALSVFRGFSSISYVHEIAEEWRAIAKPIHAYYLGDFDPSGLDLERDIREKLARYSGRIFEWERLAVVEEDFTRFDLLPLQAKASDARTKWFFEAGYTECAELDAIPAPALRERIEQAILTHIPVGEWEQLQHIERLERSRWEETISQLHGEAIQ